MQATETLSQGLKREYQVVLPAGELAEKLDAQIASMKDKVQIKGFRPGKVPVGHLKRVYGKSIMGDVVQEAVNAAQQKILDDNKLRLAGAPKFNFPEDRGEMEKVLEANGDLTFSVAFEILPTIEVGTFDDVEIESLVAEVPESDIEDSIKRLVERNRPYNAREEGAGAEKDDKLTIDFVGKIGDEAFEGGTAQGVDLVLGSGQFIPGFEDQLVGAKVGDDVKVTVTFPADYSAENLAGKEAVFDVKVTAVAAPGEQAVDDEFAKGFGFESAEKLREGVADRIKGDYAKASRDKLKRALLDALDKKYSFDLPQELVEQEFQGIWNQAMAQQRSTGKTFEDEGTTEEAQRADYRRIAERRVRLGLVVAEVGDSAGVQVTEDEVTRGIVEQARAFPGQEKMLWDYYQKNPQALAQIRAPIFEDKVIDHILAKAKVTEKTVSKEELFKPLDDEQA
ncbi:trigger factor [Rhodoblastus acidophilus]|uniref:Trigger factor n=1 Tax=Rhodoblastus acidophilus TaxID=1074 RepID=A0A212QI39_RHOAC|nr:trigger factor [Rhodoblastus acidophilus]PPQ39993.1 trigger factor [Rhodoblastus acidophilus]RAI23234.1 trigger factor [Rhodoblastus acidophilus]SNB59079.1 trigger factor [Rhodoblastus acidophilus]